MNKKLLFFLGFLILGAVFFALEANDGSDRYAGAYANELWLFPDDPVLMSGYRVLPKDGPGGADGDRAFRWTRKQSIALVRVAAYDTEKEMGKGNHAMPVFDLSAENGDTPVDFSPGKTPRGRHPGGSHDGGLNLDLGYYMTSLKGLQYTPDHSACSDHFASSAKGKKPKDTYTCNSAPDRLDVDRQAYFMLRLLKINRELFQGDFLEQIGMDWKIQEALATRLESWSNQGKYGVEAFHIDDFRRICIADRYEGWARSHHHHIHMRLRDISLFGKHRNGFAALFAREREIDRVLLAAAKEGDLLRTRLYSYAMQRAVEMELLNPVKPGSTVRFRAGGGKWISPDPAHWNRTRAMIDLPMKLKKYGHSINIDAEVTEPGQEKRITTVKMNLPRLEPHLFVAVNPDKLSGEVSRSGNQWTARLKVPEIYRTYITGISFEIIKDNSRETQEGSIIDFSYIFNTTETIRLINATLTLSSRMKIKTPIYCNID